MERLEILTGATSDHHLVYNRHVVNESHDVEPSTPCFFDLLWSKLLRWRLMIYTCQSNLDVLIRLYHIQTVLLPNERG